MIVDKFPLVTLIIPIRNESIFIKKCLEAVKNQDYLGEIEIVIADGMSTDNTREIIHHVMEDNPHLNMKVIDNPGKIVPKGMNLALKQTKGAIVVRVDGHCIIATDYIRKCVEYLSRESVDGVGGPIDTIGENHIAKVISLAMSSQFGVGNSAFRTIKEKSMLVDSVPFPAYTHKIISVAGLYDEELVRNQDDEYNYRIRELGGKILLAKDVKSTYFSRASLKHLWRQYFQYGYWKVRVLQKHPLQMRMRQFVPPIFVLSLLFSLILAFLPDWRFFASVVPLLYIFANLSASLYTAIKYKWKYLPLLPIVFAILHFSYGLGFLVGLIKFWNRWGDRTGKVPTFD